MRRRDYIGVSGECRAGIPRTGFLNMSWCQDIKMVRDHILNHPGFQTVHRNYGVARPTFGGSLWSKSSFVWIWIIGSLYDIAYQGSYCAHNPQKPTRNPRFYILQRKTSFCGGCGLFSLWSLGVVLAGLQILACRKPDHKLGRRSTKFCDGARERNFFINRGTWISATKS